MTLSEPLLESVPAAPAVVSADATAADAAVTPEDAGPTVYTDAENAAMQQKAKDHLWMHFSRQSVVESGA